METPRVTYIIASTMRTGSYLLCEGLEATGYAGHPREIFCPERIENYAGNWLLPPGVGFERYLLEAIKRGTTENGVFGFKIHGHHVEPLARERGVGENPWQILRQLFPGAKYIRLTRRNRRAQAISWYRAVVTNEWWRIPGVSDWDLTGKQPEFNGEEIRRREIELDRQERAWDEFFATQPGELINMDYDTLSANYRDEVARVLTMIGEDAALVKALPEPRLVRQSDALTEEWQRKMDAEFPR